MLLWFRGRRSAAFTAVLFATGLVGMGWLVLVGGVLAARNHLSAQRRTGAAHA